MNVTFYCIGCVVIITPFINISKEDKKILYYFKIKPSLFCYFFKAVGLTTDAWKQISDHQIGI